MNHTVLVVEDESLIRAPLCEYLRRQGVRVLEASDGEEAIAIFDSERPEVILLDLLMPKVDGFEVLRHIRARDPGVPVIVDTNLSKGYAPDKWAELGTTDVVSKANVSLKELADKVMRYFPS